MTQPTEPTERAVTDIAAKIAKNVVEPIDDVAGLQGSIDKAVRAAAKVLLVLKRIDPSVDETEFIYRATRQINETLLEGREGWTICYRCGTAMTENDEWTDAMAMDEHLRTFGIPVNKEHSRVVCEDCYNEFVTWAQKEGFVQGGTVS